MIDAEMLYQKAKGLDTVHLQEAYDFVQFLLSKNTAPTSQQETIWVEVQQLHNHLKQKQIHFSDSAGLIREEREA